MLNLRTGKEMTRRETIKGGLGLAAILAAGKAPAYLLGARGVAFGKSLPYDEEVEYLFSNYNQYIDTGVVIDSNYYYSSDYEIYLRAQTRWIADQFEGANYSHYFGCNTNNRWCGFWFGTYLTNKYTVEGASFKGFQYSHNYDREYLDAEFFDLKLYNDGYILNQETKRNLNVNETGFPTDSILLFRSRFGRNSFYIASAVKIFRFRINKIIDLIPVLKDGIACMYDKINSNFYHNLGSGTFGYKKKDGTIVDPT